MGALGGLNNMASLAGVTLPPSQPTISNPPVHSNNVGTVSNLAGGVPAISAEQWQSAYSGIQQYVGKAVCSVFYTNGQPYQVYRIRTQLLVVFVIFIVVVVAFLLFFVCLF